MTENGVFHLSIKSPIWTETNPSLKGTVSPFPHPEFVPNLYSFLSSDENKRKYFVTKFLVPIKFHSFFHTMEVNGDQQMYAYHGRH